jgi:hypothetical protein
MPSLNEEATLQHCCESLGFQGPMERLLPATFLFIVDNGSTDATLDVAGRIQCQTAHGSVFIGQEQERGYVPPRHKGNMMVKAFAEQKGLDLSEILILQADSDTSYSEGYIERMRSASRDLGSGFLVEGLAEFPPRFCASFPEYVNLCREIDARVLSALKCEATLLCTDAVCGYRLNDYLTWGGHLREYDDDGGEVHAETTRLYMRAIAHGAQKSNIEQALAHPSERKLVGRPAEELASAGFPREPSWQSTWERKCHSITLADFRVPLGHPEIVQAIRSREKHLVALFGILPLHVNRALGGDLPPAAEILRSIAASLPERDEDMLLHRPGVFLTDVLDLLERHGALLLDVLEEKGALDPEQA